MSEHFAPRHAEATIYSNVYKDGAAAHCYIFSLDILIEMS